MVAGPDGAGGGVSRGLAGGGAEPSSLLGGPLCSVARELLRRPSDGP